MHSPSLREVSLAGWRRCGSGAGEVLAVGEDSEGKTLMVRFTAASPALTIMVAPNGASPSMPKSGMGAFLF